MQPATQALRVNHSWQTPRNTRSLRAFMALRNQEIGERLRELRGRKPQTAVAEELGVAERTLQGWELGEAKPSYRNLQRLAAYFGVREEFILAGEGDAPAPPSTTPDLSRDATQLDRIEREVARLHARLDALTPLLPGIAELLGPKR